MWYVCDVLYAVLYVRVSCFVVCGCAVSRRYIYVCYCDMFSVVNVYLDYLKFCIVCVYGRRYVCYGECYVVSNECLHPTFPPDFSIGPSTFPSPTRHKVTIESSPPVIKQEFYNEI